MDRPDFKLSQVTRDRRERMNLEVQEFGNQLPYFLNEQGELEVAEIRRTIRLIVAYYMLTILWTYCAYGAMEKRRGL